MTATATSIKAGMRPPWPAPGEGDDALDQAAADFAARAGALADLLQRWRRPAVARTVIASLLNEDGDTFRELLRDFDPPVLGKCWWVRDIVEQLVAAVELRSVCRLRTDLTPGERRLYLRLALLYRESGHLIARPGAGLHADGGRGPEIAPGAFLDALRVEGLVVCSDEPVEGAGLQQVLARPALLCV
jgi:hypothetical protein